MLLTVMLTGHTFGLLPRLGGSTLAAVLLLATCVVGSIWLGRRSAGFTRWPKYVLNASSLFLVLFGVAGFLQADQDRLFSGGYDYQPAYNGNPYSNVQDVYVYDREGRLVEGVRLFDQNGEPIRLGSPWCPEARLALADGDFVQQTYPYCPQRAPFRFAVSGPTAEAAPTATPLPSPTGAMSMRQPATTR